MHDLNDRVMSDMTMEMACMINYYLLTKPGIIMGNLVTLAAGFLLASKGEIISGYFSQLLMGLAFIMASACVFNNYIDRQVDEKMERTKNRALVKGLISGRNAILVCNFSWNPRELDLAINIPIF